MGSFADGLFVVLWVVGLLGSFFPIFPSTWLILGAALLHGLLTGFAEASLGLWVVLGLLGVAALLLDNVAAMVGAARFGASRWGIWGAVIGSLLGLVVLPPIGLLVLPLVGALVGELLAGRTLAPALRATWGTLLGMLGGVFVRLILHIAMGWWMLRSIF